MSFKLLSALSFVAVALAAPRAADSLIVSISPLANSFKSSEVKLNATVSNPTGEDIKVIRIESILDDLPTYSFKATKDGKNVDFSGIHVRNLSSVWKDLPNKLSDNLGYSRLDQR
jgi:deuterolysin